MKLFFLFNELTKTESTAGTCTIRAIKAITAIHHAFFTDFHKKNITIITNILRSFELASCTYTFLYKTG